MPLSADELDEVMSLAWPLPTEVRAAFVTAVENALGGYSLGARGAGLAHRVAISLQRDFFIPPPPSPPPQLFNARRFRPRQ
jgi:hypothetical protein